MVNKWKAILEKEGLFITVMLLFVIFHFLVQPGGDDLGRMNVSGWTYREVIRDTLNFCKGHPRYLVYFTLNTLCWLPGGVFLWRVLDCVMLGIIIKSLVKLSERKEKVENLVILLVCLYPFEEMLTAGALSTTIGYIWVLAAGLGSLVLLKISDERNLKWWELCLLIIAAAFANNQEQLCMILCVTYLIVCIYACVTGRRRLLLMGILTETISLLSAIVLFGAALHGGRSDEIILFKDFGALSFVDKFEMAFSSTADHILYDNGIILIFTGILLFLIWEKTNRKTYLMVGMVPFILCCLGSMSGKLFENFRWAINTNVGKNVKYGAITVENYQYISGYVQIFVMFLIGALILLEVYLVGNSRKEGLIAIAILLLGIMGRMSLMFTVNIVLSATRTYLFLWFALIGTLIYVVANNYERVFKPFFARCPYIKKALSGCIPIVACIALINNLLICVL